MTNLDINVFLNIPTICNVSVIKVECGIVALALAKKVGRDFILESVHVE
jgi:hypothetical protein